ncbi:MAG: hypothetical protein IKQ91_10495 [Oscillospiraceae bacterium]|nr:hypothetical protein [Oscillospiraceae bacterium]
MKHTNLTSRLLRTACAAVMSFTLCGSLSASAATNAPLMGDLSGNRQIGLEDAQSALKTYTFGMGGVASAEANSENGAGDIDMDGEISLGDAGKILRYYTETLGGYQPLWADIRKVSYVDGTDFYSYFETDENGNPVLDNEGQPVLIRPNADSPFQLKGMYIEIGCASGKPGDTVTVPVYVAGLPQLAGFQLSVGHDPRLKAQEITSDLPEKFGWGSDSHNMDNNPSFDDTHGCVVMAQATDLSINDGCVIASFSYQIPADAESGDSYMLDVSPDYTKFITAQCVSYQYTALSGVVSVK